jgi:hypothetical protein
MTYRVEGSSGTDSGQELNQPIATTKLHTGFIGLLQDGRKFDKIFKNTLKILVPIILLGTYLWLFNKEEIKKHAIDLWKMNIVGGFLGSFGTWLYKKK